MISTHINWRKQDSIAASFWTGDTARATAIPHSRSPTLGGQRLDPKCAHETHTKCLERYRSLSAEETGRLFWSRSSITYPVKWWSLRSNSYIKIIGLESPGWNLQNPRETNVLASGIRSLPGHENSLRSVTWVARCVEPELRGEKARILNLPLASCAAASNTPGTSTPSRNKLLHLPSRTSPAGWMGHTSKVLS